MPARIDLTQRQKERLQMAHQAMMIDDATKMLALNRQQNLAHSRMVADMPVVPEDDVSIHVGDKYEAPQSGSGTLGKVLAGAAIGAGLLTTGGMAGLGAAALMRPTTPPAVVAPAPIVMAPQATPQPMEFDEVEQRLQADGTWIATGRTVRKRLLPDGSTQTRGEDGIWK